MADLGIGGRWVSIAFKDENHGAFSRVELTAVVDGPEGPEATSLSERAFGHGRFTWLGRLPAGTTALTLTPMLGEAALSIAEFTVTVRSRLALVGRAALRRPVLTGQALFWRAVGKRVRSQHRLARALVPPGLTGYDTWVRHFDTLREADRVRIAAEVAQWRDVP